MKKYLLTVCVVLLGTPVLVFAGSFYALLLTTMPHSTSRHTAHVAFLRTPLFTLAFPILAALFVLIMGMGIAYAETTPTSASRPITVATVNIYDAKILTQSGNIFTISFDLSNREGAQPGVRYAVQLLRGSESAVVDEYIYSEVVNLNSNTSLAKSVEYMAPAYLAGTYTLTLVSRNTNGLTLAHALLGEVTLSGTGPYVEILPSTCFLQVSGEKSDAKYTLDQGVDITASETLNLTCTVENHSTSDQTLTPVFKTFLRNTFGEYVETPVPPQNPITVSAGKKKVLTLLLPKATTPQSYDVQVSFGNTNNVPSNSIVVHYVLRGEGATIQNITLDKTSYAAGDIALISLFWTGSASNFFNARTTPVVVPGMQVIVSIVSSAGSCGGDVTIALDPQRSTQVVPFPINRTCDSPKVSVRLVDSAGIALASSTFDFQSSVPPKKTVNGSTLIYFVLALAVLALFYGVMRVFRGRAADGATLVLLGFCILSYGLPSAAHADTFTQDVYLVNPGSWQGLFTVYYDVNLNKAVFAPGETITATGNVTSGACGNALQGAITATINAQNKDVYRTFFHYNYYTEILISSNTFTAESTPGNYFARFYPELHVPTEGSGHDHGSYFCLPDDPDCGGGVHGPGGQGGNSGKTSGRTSWVSSDPYNMPYTIVCPTGQVQQGTTCITPSCPNGLNITQYPSCTCPTGQVQQGSVCVTPDRPPTTPRITGDATCTVGVPYHVSMVSTDPDGDDFWYYRWWGTTPNPGQPPRTTLRENWSAQYPSGTPGTDSYTFTSPGYYEFWAYAKDEGGLESNWSWIGITCSDTVSCSNGLNITQYPSCTCPAEQVQQGSGCVTPSTRCTVTWNPRGITSGGSSILTITGEHSGQVWWANTYQDGHSDTGGPDPFPASWAGSLTYSTPVTSVKYTFVDSTNGASCFGTLAVCPIGQSWNGSSCTCSAGQTWNGTQCVSVPSCPAGQSWNGIACACPTGTVWNGTQCKAQCIAGYFCKNNNVYHRTVSCVESPLPVYECTYGCSNGACNPPPAPIMSLTVNPVLVRSGKPVTLKWSATNVVSCIVSGTNGQSWSCIRSACAPQTVKQSIGIVAQTTFTFTCTALPGRTPNANSISRTVNIIPVWCEPGSPGCP